MHTIMIILFCLNVYGKFYRDMYLLFGITTDGEIISRWVERCDLDSKHNIEDGEVIPRFIINVDEKLICDFCLKEGVILNYAEGKRKCDKCCISGWITLPWPTFKDNEGNEE